MVLSLRSVICTSIAFLILVLQGTEATAQKVKVHLGGGANWYSGDLQNDIPPIKEIHPSASIGVSYDVTSRARLKLETMFGGVSGSDANSSNAAVRYRNLNFSSKLSEVALLYQYDLISPAKSAIVPYVFAGVSVYNFLPTTRDSIGRLVYLQSIGTEGQYLSGNIAGKGEKYSLTQFNVQGGIGVRAQITEFMALGLEYSVRNLFTDYLDDVSSKSYISQQTFASQNQAAAYQFAYRGLGVFNQSLQRGNPNANDRFHTLQLKLTIGFPKEEGYHSERNVKIRKQLRCP